MFLQHFKLRQKSVIALNRRIKWNQQPPNFDDYAPECLQSGAMAPFQQGPPPLEEQAELRKKRPRSESVGGGETPKAKEAVGRTKPEQQQPEQQGFLNYVGKVSAPNIFQIKRCWQFL